VKQSLTLVMVAFACGLMAAALLNQTILLVEDWEPLAARVILPLFAGALVFFTQWVVDFIENRNR
jgi:hypothetical protein